MAPVAKPRPPPRKSVGWVEFFMRPNDPERCEALGLATARPNLPLCRMVIGRHGRRAPPLPAHLAPVQRCRPIAQPGTHGRIRINPVVAVIAPGMMGAAVGKRLVDHGLKVLTSLKGRSAETTARAKAAGMVSAGDGGNGAATDSSCRSRRRATPSRWRRESAALTGRNHRPIYVDCNAVARRRSSASPPPSRQAVAPSSMPASSARLPDRAMPAPVSRLRPGCAALRRPQDFGLEVRM